MNSYQGNFDQHTSSARIVGSASCMLGAQGTFLHGGAPSGKTRIQSLADCAQSVDCVRAPDTTACKWHETLDVAW
eukprot:3185728-Amphidinium_carterae.1